MDKKVSISLKKASGNIRKTLSILESGRSLIDLLQMNAATLGLLRSAQRMIIQNCIKERLKGGASQPKKANYQKNYWKR